MKEIKISKKNLFYIKTRIKSNESKKFKENVKCIFKRVSKRKSNMLKTNHKNLKFSFFFSLPPLLRQLSSLPNTNGFEPHT